VTVSLAAATVIGLVFHLYLKQRGLTLAQIGGDPEKVFMVMVNGIFSGGAVVRIFAGILLSAIMAAIMSTADSQLLVSASAFSNDFYKVVLRRKAGASELVAVSRVAVGAVALAALFMAMNEKSDFFKVVMKMVSFAWAGFGAAFGPAIVFGLFWKRMTKWGALAGIVSGGAMVFIWKYLVRPLGGAWDIYELLPAFVLGAVVIVVVSLVTKAPDKEVTDKFDEVKAYCKAK
jgi:sodium/proline symporter